MDGDIELLRIIKGGEKKLKKSFIPMILASALLVSSTASAQETSTKEGITQVSNAIIQQELQKAKDNGANWLKRVDISIHVETSQKPIYTLETVQPIGTMSEHVTTFTQFRISNNSDAGTIANLGFGKRYLSSDKNSMKGINVFYDHGFKHGHARVGGGLEYFQGLGEYRLNIYQPVSGEKEVDSINHIFERAISGADFEVGTNFPGAQWAKIYAKVYTWNYKYSDDARGYKIRTELQLTPQLNLEVGYWNDNKSSGDTYLKIMYSLGKKAVSAFGSNRKAERVTVESKRLDKVQRENDIRIERYQKINTGTGNVRIVIQGR